MQIRSRDENEMGVRRIVVVNGAGETIISVPLCVNLDSCFINVATRTSCSVIRGWAGNDWGATEPSTSLPELMIENERNLAVTYSVACLNRIAGAGIQSLPVALHRIHDFK